MRISDYPPLWSVSKANAAALTSIFVVTWVGLAVAQTAPDWSVLPFILALLFGSWWSYRWHGDRQLAQRNHSSHAALHQMPQAQLTSVRTTPGSTRDLFLPSVTDPDALQHPSRPDAHS